MRLIIWVKTKLFGIMLDERIFVPSYIVKGRSKAARIEYHADLTEQFVHRTHCGT